MPLLPPSMAGVLYGDLPVIMIDALYCRSEAVLLAMHVWLYVVAVLYMVSDAGRPHGVVRPTELSSVARSVD